MYHLKLSPRLLFLVEGNMKGLRSLIMVSGSLSLEVIPQSNGKSYKCLFELKDVLRLQSEKRTG